MDDQKLILINSDIVDFKLEYLNTGTDQGVKISIMLNEKKHVCVLEFNCLNQNPTYTYGPNNKKVNKTYYLDQTTEDDALEWSLLQIRSNLDVMLSTAGYQYIANIIESKNLTTVLKELENTARSMAKEKYDRVTHNRGEIIIEAGPIRFGLEFRNTNSDNGIAIHVLGDISGIEYELLAFDCFDIDPHHHYGPRNKNLVFDLDTTINPNPLQWVITLFKGGKLPTMLEKAGYYDHALRLNPQIIIEKTRELELAATRLNQTSNDKIK